MHIFESYFGYDAPDDDLDPNADRGDDFTPTDDDVEEDTHPVTGQPRGKDGKFSAKDDVEDDPDGGVGGDLDLDKKLEEQNGKGKAGKKPAEKKEEKPAEDEEDHGDETEEEEEEESEEESEEEDEAEDEEDAEGDDKGKAKGKGKDNLGLRFNKMREQRDRERILREAAEAELERLRKPADDGKKKEPEPDPIAKINEELDGLYEQVEEARADGETKTAAQLQRKIDGLNRQIANIEAEKTSKKTTAIDAETRRFDVLLGVMESRVSVLNTESEDFDQQAVKDLEDLVVGYEHAGLSPSAALVKAVKLLHKVDLTQKAAAPAKKAEEKGDEGAGKKKDPPAKKGTDVKKVADASKKQPPDSSRHGSDQDSQKVDITKLSDAEFAALPESVKAKHRGDDI